MCVCVCFSVYATTAANSHESSYACYYDEKRLTYLGDWYSVNWMEDSDAVGVDFPRRSCLVTRVCCRPAGWRCAVLSPCVCDVSGRSSRDGFNLLSVFCQTLRLQEDLKKETLLKQFKIVKSHTNTSHVQQFGNKVKKSLCVFY